MSDAVPVPAGADLAQRLRAHFGPRVVERPPPSLLEGLRSVGGFLVAAGVLVLAGDRYGDDANGLAILIAFLLFAGGVVALVRAPEEYVTPAVVVTGVAAVAVGFFVVADNADPSLSLAGFFVAGLAGALYAVPPRRGHTFHLVVALAAVWFAMLALVQGSVSDLVGGSLFGGGVSDVGLMSVLVGGAYLAVGWWLDRSGLRAAATPFLAIGALALAFGMFALVSGWNEVGGGLLAAVVGGTISVTGAQTDRRFGTWFGLVVLGGGLIGVASGISPDDAAVVDFLLLAAMGGGIVYASMVLADRGPLAPPGQPESPDSPPPPASGPPPAPPPGPPPRFNI